MHHVLKKKRNLQIVWNVQKKDKKFSGTEKISAWRGGGVADPPRNKRVPDTLPPEQMSYGEYVK